MKRLAIVGGGIAGLSVGRLVRDRFETVVFERNSSPGGLMACELINGHLFHRCGGHVFNSKDRRVLDWFWGIFNRDRDFRKAERNAVIALQGMIVPYPIEFSVRQLPPAVQSEFLFDLTQMETQAHLEPQNFDEFLRTCFGQTLYDLYFGPYNRKIWQCDLRTIPLAWMKGKLPQPSLQELRHAYEYPTKERAFVHSSFWYPNCGGSQFIADTLSQGMELRVSSEVKEIRESSDGRLEIGDESFDEIFFCGNVRELPRLMPALVSGDLGLRLESLPAHGTTTAFCEVDCVPYSWMYQPDSGHASHRMIFTGNFAPENDRGAALSASVEFTGRLVEAEIREQLARMPFHPHLLGYHWTPCSYPIQTPETRAVVQTVKEALRRHHVHLVGRFAEWEYFNMDAVIASAIDQVSGLAD